MTFGQAGLDGFRENVAEASAWECGVAHSAATPECYTQLAVASSSRKVPPVGYTTEYSVPTEYPRELCKRQEGMERVRQQREAPNHLGL